MFIPLYPGTAQSSLFALPQKWAGNTAPDGDAAPWVTAPLGSEYTCITAGNVTLYQKTANNSADADWVAFATS